MAKVTGAGPVLREGLLAGVGVAVSRASSPDGGFADAVVRVCTDLGARVLQWPVCDQAKDADAAPRLHQVDVLVNDAAGIYLEALRAEDGDGLLALRSCLDTTWRATRTLTGAAASAGGGGRVINLAPPDGAGPHADAVRAALENLARTLSIEWARHEITAVAIAPGPHATSRELATLVAYLASPAGAYFSGCQFDLRGPSGAGRPAPG